MLKEIPLSVVLRERLAETDTKIDALKQENADLRQLVKQKDGEIDNLKKELAIFNKPDTYITGG